MYSSYSFLQKLHRHQQRGKITGYMVNVMLQLDNGEINVQSQNATSTVLFVLGKQFVSIIFLISKNICIFFLFLTVKMFFSLKTKPNQT